MTHEEIVKRLEKTGIPREEETATPTEGAAVSLPYFTIRTAEVDEWDDAGRVCITKTVWTVTLFTVNKEEQLEQKIRRALSAVGKVTVDAFPDETPYQVDFTFTTRGV